MRHAQEQARLTPLSQQTQVRQGLLYQKCRISDLDTARVLARNVRITGRIGVTHTDLGAAKVQETPVAAEDPPLGKARVPSQLVLGHGRVEDRQSVEPPLGQDHGEPRAQHHQPGLGPVLRVAGWIVAGM